MTSQHPESTVRRENAAPDPDHDAKPDSPTELKGQSWGYVFKRAVSEFSKDGCTDLAATLTYFAVLSIFPALLALVSLLGVFGQGEATTNAILDFLNRYAPAALVDLLSGPISQLTTQSGAGFALVVGVVGALWTASGYTGAFARAMNRIYEISEGRPFWKLKPIMLLITLIIVLIVAAVMFMVLLSGDFAQTVGDLVGLGSTTVTVWNWAKLPVILFLLVLLIAILYYATPNVKQPKFKWLSPGAAIALVFMIIAGLGFAFYVANFSSYNATYGVIGSVIILLLGLWIMNNVLLFGAEVDAELERGRQLQGGIRAEHAVQLPPRDTAQVKKQKEKEEKLEAEGRKIRLRTEHVDYSQDS
ncbi:MULTISPECIES: YihY/virulence factor BrkB family protein [Kocuria]|uniref:YihY/virulence factor BrkB family protein n=1 Tax=Kocuria TaxID=57493 RepID=UPI0007EB2261|nr:MULTISPECIES: YihY/virulence factor BrkB family protein [Kocuria]MCT1723258.1 YihY/virulence factor BrkB family protein [Kocuria marina]MCT1736013.1 YihY/virulence factor BrkB family protein [Kocuria marina]MCT2362482.1 YihY/virulence factor BrkB family protein [Kocuria marina]OBA49632.1 ribonuclease BN [Kocuria sp. ICS0012]